MVSRWDGTIWACCKKTLQQARFYVFFGLKVYTQLQVAQASL